MVSGRLLSTHYRGLVRSGTMPVTGTVYTNYAGLRTIVRSANVGYSVLLPTGETYTLTAQIKGGRCAPITLTITKAPIVADFQCTTGTGLA